MPKFNITLRYEAQYGAIVEADDEGQAYDKVRNLAENADMNEFILSSEKEAKCEHL